MTALMLGTFKGPVPWFVCFFKSRAEGLSSYSHSGRTDFAHSLKSREMQRYYHQFTAENTRAQHKRRQIYKVFRQVKKPHQIVFGKGTTTVSQQKKKVTSKQDHWRNL